MLRVCDAETERDIELVGAALRTVNATPVGSYGLARAWARERDGGGDGRQGVIAAVGSLEPATLAQVAAARAAGVHVEILGSDLSSRPGGLRRGENVVLASADPDVCGVPTDPRGDRPDGRRDDRTAGDGSRADSYSSAGSSRAS